MKNFLTYGQLDYTCMKAAGNLNENDIFKGVRQSYINNRMMKIYALLDGLNDPFYNKTMVITTAADQEYLKSDSIAGGTISAISGSLKQIHRVGGAFIAGSLISCVSIKIADGTVHQQWTGIITSGSATATIQVLSGTMLDYASGDTAYSIGVCITKSLSVASADLSGTYFKNIVRISDNKYTTTPGAQVRVFDKIEDPQIFYNLDKDPFAKDRIAWYQRGDTIDLFVGATAITVGTVTCEYRGKPGIFSDATIDDVIELPPEHNQLIIDEVVTAFLIDRGKDIPGDVTARLKAFYDAAEAQLQKAKKTENK